MSSVARLLGLVRPHWPWLLLAAALGAIGTGANVALVGVSAALISQSAIAGNVAEVALIITSVRVLAIVRSGALYLERVTSHRVAFRVLTELRVWFFGAVEPLAPAGFIHRRSGDILARAIGDIDELRDLATNVIVPPIVAIIVAAAAGLVFAAVDLRLGVVLFAGLLVTGVAVPIGARVVVRQQATTEARLRGEVAALAVDEVSGVADLIAFGQAERHRARLLATAAERDRLRRRSAAADAISDAIVIGGAAVVGLASLWLAIGLVLDGRLDGVLLASIPLAAIATFEAVGPLQRSMRRLEGDRAAAARTFEIIDAPPAVAEPAEPSALPNGSDLELDEASFRYGREEPPVLEALSLRVGAGERLLISGPSGAGKSTIVDLLVRFWDVGGGAVRLGGTDVRDLASDDLRSRLGVVPQRIDLFDTTIRENLALAHPDVSDERIVEACRMAQLTDWIDGLPDGYDTLVGEGGENVSGGERRRLGIARLIIKDAPVAILDEPTADLDAETAARLWASMRPFFEGRTLIVLAHRPVAGLPTDGEIRLTLPG